MKRRYNTLVGGGKAEWKTNNRNCYSYDGRDWKMSFSQPYEGKKPGSRG